MQKGSMIAEIRSLRHLKIDFFCSRWVSKKKKEPDIPDWVSVDRTTFNQIKNKIKKVNDKNIYVSPNCGFYISADH